MFIDTPGRAQSLLFQIENAKLIQGEKVKVQLQCPVNDSKKRKESERVTGNMFENKEFFVKQTKKHFLIIFFTGNFHFCMGRNGMLTFCNRFLLNRNVEVRNRERQR